MKANVEKHPVLNRILMTLNFSLELVLFFIAMGIIMGVYELLS